MISYPIKYSIATNWDCNYINTVHELNIQNSRSKVVEFFGASRQNIIGSGRNPWQLPEVSKNTIIQHINTINKLGYNFNWIMNSYNNSMSDLSQQNSNKLFNFLSKLIDWGVNIVTVSNVELIKYIKEHFPSLQIKLSLIAGVDTVDKAKYFESIGIDTINLNPHTINRDFKTLKKIREAVKCRLILYANIPCLSNCSYRDGHYKTISSNYKSNSLWKSDSQIDYYQIKCSSIFLDNPIEFIKSPFIRPEDINFYRKLGIDGFKLSDRIDSSEHLIETAKAYLNSSYDGNLFHLIFRDGKKFILAMGENKIGSYSLPSIFIDNNVLTQYKFIRNISSLNDSKLEEYYETIMKLAYQVKDSKAINILKNDLISF